MRRINNPWEGMSGYRCFGCAPDNAAGVKMEFYAEGDEVISLWKPQPQFQGWLDTLHGGIQSVLLDEICGWVVIYTEQSTGMTTRMETQFKKPISTNDPYVLLRARIKERKRNILFIESAIYNTHGELCSSALCTYYVFSKEKARSEMYFRDVGLEEKEWSLDEVIERMERI